MKMEKELEIYLKKSTSGILSGKRKGCYHSTFDVYFHLKFGNTNNVQLSTTVSKFKKVMKFKKYFD